MILQRLAQAIRRQDWFQVVIEVLIVIVGIYLGLQVTEWADERQERIEERAYLERLHVEIDRLTTLNKERNEGNLFYFDKLATVAEALTTENSNIELGKDHCDVILLTVVYTSQAAATPTMTELVASGQLSLISDQSLRTAIARYLLTKQTYDDVLANLRADKNDLTMKYPALVNLSVRSRISGSNVLGAVDVTCDFDAMQQDASFKNDLVNNYSRGSTFVRYNEVIFDRLNAIHDRLDEILGIAHEGDG